MNYRIYILDRRLRAVAGHNFDARDDVAALERGIFLGEKGLIEVWQKSRLGARIGMDGEAIPDRSKSHSSYHAHAAQSAGDYVADSLCALRPPIPSSIHG